jgi:hypothetical protein
VSYLAMTALVLVSCYLLRGLRRGAGVVIVAAYVAFAIALVALAY